MLIDIIRETSDKAAVIKINGEPIDPDLSLVKVDAKQGNYEYKWFPTAEGQRPSLSGSFSPADKTPIWLKPTTVVSFSCGLIAALLLAKLKG